MKICIIFAEKLYAIKYSNDKVNIYRKTIELWTDIEYLYNFLLKQSQDIKEEDIPNLISEISEDVLELDKLIVELSQSTNKKLDEFFAPLSNSEYKVVELSLRKARLRKSHTRIYGSSNISGEENFLSINIS